MGGVVRILGIALRFVDSDRVGGSTVRKTVTLSLFVIAVLIGATTIYQAQSASSVNILPLVKPCTFQMMVIGSYYYVVDCNTGGIRYGGPQNAGSANGKDASSVFNKAILGIGRGGVLYIKSGDYIGTSTYMVDYKNIYNGLLSVPVGGGSMFSIIGEGWDNTVLEYTGTGTAMNVTNTASVGSVEIGLKMQDFTITSVTSTGTMLEVGGHRGAGVATTQVFYSEFDNIHVLGENRTVSGASGKWNIGMSLCGVIDSVFNNVVVDRFSASGGTGTILDCQTNANSFISGQSEAKFGLNVTSAFGNVFTGYNIEKSVYGVVITANNGITIIDSYIVTGNNCIVERSSAGGNTFINNVVNCAQPVIYQGTSKSDTSRDVIIDTHAFFNQLSDVALKNVTSGATSYTFNFNTIWGNPANYPFCSPNYDVFVSPTWLTTFSVPATTRTSTSFVVNFGTASPGNNAQISIWVICPSGN